MEPVASRPTMPGYGVVAEGEGSGLLDWGWAVERLGGSHHYWLSSVRPDGRPHAMPVWGVSQPKSQLRTNRLRYPRTSAGRLVARIRPIDPAIVKTTDTGTSTIHNALAIMSTEATLVSTRPSHGLLEPLR